MLFVDIQNDTEVDIDEKEKISDIQNIVSDDKFFYVLANRKNKKIGYYLFMFEIEKAHDKDYKYTYLINWMNKTKIAQVDINFLEEVNYDIDLRDDAKMDSKDFID